MRAPTVLTPEQVAAELGRLGDQLRAARLAAGVSTRAAAQAAGCNAGTVWRIEQGRSAPTFLRFAALAAAAGVRLELDDGTDRPRRLSPERVSLPPGYVPWRPAAGWIAMPANFDEPAHWARVQLGAELSWARRNQLARPLHAAALCRLLGISRHTLTAVESGPRFPDLAMVVRVAAVTGRSVVLCDATTDLRVPPWAAA